MAPGVAVGLCVAFVTVGCGDPAPPPPQASTGSPAPTPPPAPEPATTAVQAPGAIFGRTVWRGVRPPQETITMRGGGCEYASPNPVPSPRFEVASDGGLPHTFVWVQSGPPGFDTVSAGEEPVTAEYRGCMIYPHVIGVPVGRPLRFINRDTFCGAITFGSKRNRRPDVPKLAGGASVDIVFRHEEMPLHVGCPVHTWCYAVVFVVPHPNFATTTANGEFEIAGLPPGEYDLRAWRESFTAEPREITAKFRATVELGGRTSVGDIEMK